MKITAEILTIGDEILFGQITDTNTQFISQELTKIGVKTIRKTSVGDIKDEILSAINEALTRANIVITTGGLGPTKDDITKHTIAELLGEKLIIHQPTLDFVTAFFKSKGREMTELNINQALVPESCIVLPNDLGTAPCMWFDHKQKVLISMPGVPYEMKHMVNKYVIPRIVSQFKTPFIYHKMIHTFGLGESFMAKKIEKWEDALPSHIKLAYLPSAGILKLRLTAIGDDQVLLEKEVAVLVEELKTYIDYHIFGYDTNNRLEQVIGDLLINSNQTLSVAESCTGGFLSHLFTSLSGASEYFKGAVIAYHNDIKESVLDVKHQTLVDYGAVSEQTVLEMAENIRKKFNTDFGLSVSGVAGPNGGTEEKPVGTIWIAISSKNGSKARKLTFGSNLREINIKLSALNCVNLLRENLLNLQRPNTDSI